MIIDQVRLHTCKAVGVEELDADVVVDRDDDGFVSDEKLFSLLKQRVALVQICFASGCCDQGIV